jgi:hypothetical protein
LPLSQGFESGATLPTAWSLYNPNADAAWQVLTTIGHTGTHSIGFNNYNGDGSTTNTTGRIDRFYTSTFNFAGSIAPTIKFDVAYGPLVGYADTLQVYYSTNCGVSWTSIYTKSGLTLGTTGGTVSSSTPFIPTSTQWRTETVSLTSIIGQTSVIFAFENRSGYGNWIYVDNINLANGTTGIENNAAGATTVIIYPNPFNTSATIAVQDENGIQLSGMNFILYDMVGKEVMRIDNMNAQTQFSREQLSGGLYFYKVFDKQNIIGKGKVMIQ